MRIVLDVLSVVQTHAYACLSCCKAAISLDCTCQVLRTYLSCCSEAVSYRINDEVEYNVTIERLELRQPDATTTTTDAATAAIESGEISKSRPSLVWVPYRASDVQLEFVMMDPYVRINMTQFEDASGVFSARFRVPDIHGVFHFRLQYRRPGLTVLHSTDQVSIRPFKHDEFERFIVAAADVSGGRRCIATVRFSGWTGCGRRSCRRIRSAALEWQPDGRPVRSSDFCPARPGRPCSPACPWR